MKSKLKFCLGMCIAAVSLTSTYAQPTKSAGDRASAENLQTESALMRMKDLVQLALDNSPQVREAAANWRAAQSDLAQAEGGLWPKLEIGANSSAVNLQNNSTNSLTGGLAATLSYNVHDFGRVRSQIEIREFKAASLRDKFRQAREDVAYATAGAYLQLLKYQRIADINYQYIADMRRLVENLNDIVMVFPGRRSELTQAQTRLGQARDGMFAVRSKLSEAELSLLRLTGTHAAKVQNGPPPALEALNLEALTDLAKTSHPAVLAARADASAARAQVTEANASLMPQIDLQMVNQTGQDANGLNIPPRLYLTAKWLAFDGSATKANAKAIEERARAANERGEQVIQEVLFNIGNAVAEHENYSSRNRDLEQLVKSTDQVRKDYYDQWRELGRRSLLEVLTSENEHLTTQTNLVSTALDERLAVVRMRHEAGNFAEWLSTLTANAKPNPAQANAGERATSELQLVTALADNAPVQVVTAMQVPALMPAQLPAPVPVPVSPAVVLTPAKTMANESVIAAAPESQLTNRVSNRFGPDNIPKAGLVSIKPQAAQASAGPVLAPTLWTSPISSNASEIMSVPPAKF